MWLASRCSNRMEDLSFEVTGKPAASNIFVLVISVGTARRLEVEQKLEFLAILILDWTAVNFFVKRCFFFACRKVNSLAIDGGCRQVHLPHATFSHVQSLHRSHSTEDMCAWLKFELRPRNRSVIHGVMFHLAPHSTTNTSTSSLSTTSPVFAVVLFSESRPVVHASICPLWRSTAGWYIYGIPLLHRKRAPECIVLGRTQQVAKSQRLCTGRPVSISAKRRPSFSDCR